MRDAGWLGGLICIFACCLAWFCILSSFWSFRSVITLIYLVLYQLFFIIVAGFACCFVVLSLFVALCLCFYGGFVVDGYFFARFRWLLCVRLMIVVCLGDLLVYVCLV